jgi:arginyl-tRNA synthetase
MDTNLFDYFDEATGGDDAQAHWALRAPYSPHERFDLMLVPRSREWREDRGALDALERIGEEPWVAAVEQDRNGAWLRLDDEWVAKRGAELEQGADAVAGCGEVARGRRFALNFWDANSTKALHIGHLRNLALGNALGNALTEAGGEVERRSIICDIGRSMGEAMAGVVRSGKYPQTSSDGNGVKPDHFVGYCYADYVKNGANGAALGLAQDHPADSLTREVDVQEDSADELLQRVLAGDQSALELWSQTRAWVISGQRKTLARLGIYFDRVFFESDFLPEVIELAELGLQEGTLEKRVDGTVIYMTGREELEEMPLVRSDGVPTQHMRALAYWLADTGLDGSTSVQVCGQEWFAHVTCRRQLMAELVHTGEGNGFHPYHDIFHGMVAKEKEKIASSKKDALLIDHLVEWIDEQLEADPQRAEVRQGHPSPDRLPSQVALGFFLLHTATKRVDFSPEKLLRDDKALGWDLARARSRNGSASGPAGAAQTQNGAGEPQLDPEYRFAVVQAETYGRLLGRVTRNLDVAPLARYASHLARWQLEGEHAPHTDRVVQSTLDRTARGLGLEEAR